MSELPWYRTFPTDWLADTRGLKPAEVGILTAICWMIMEAGEPVKEDHARLARRCATTPRSLMAILEVLIDEGLLQRIDGCLMNARIAQEIDWREEKSQKSTRAANKRWKKSQQNQGASHAGAIREQCQSESEAESEADASEGAHQARPSSAKPSRSSSTSEDSEAHRRTPAGAPRYQEGQEISHPDYPNLGRMTCMRQDSRTRVVLAKGASEFDFELNDDGTLGELIASDEIPF